MKRFLVFSICGLVAAHSLVAAPAVSARGLADCFSATARTSFTDPRYYEVTITDRCGTVHTSNPAFGKRVSYTIEMGFYCQSRSGSISRGSLGFTERVDLKCLAPGFHSPQVYFQSFSDGSRNTVYLPTLTVRPPETPRPTPTPTPTPSRAPIPQPLPAVPAPSLPTAAPNPGVVLDSRYGLPAAASVSYSTKRRGTGKPTARLSNDEVTVNISTKLRPRTSFSVEVLGPVGIGDVSVPKRSGGMETRAFRDWYNFPVGRNGQVTFTVPTTAFNDITVRDSRGKVFLRLYTSSGCAAESRFTLSCSGRGQ